MVYKAVWTYFLWRQLNLFRYDFRHTDTKTHPSSCWCCTCYERRFSRMVQERLEEISSSPFIPIFIQFRSVWAGVQNLIFLYFCFANFKFRRKFPFSNNNFARFVDIFLNYICGLHSLLIRFESALCHYQFLYSYRLWKLHVETHLFAVRSFY